MLDRQTSHPAFESFYRDHIRKLLRVRGGRRYLAKGNYNVTRLEYLLQLFPDARFVIPVRDPRWHIASLIKQHALFCPAARGTRRRSAICSGSGTSSSGSTGARSTPATGRRSSGSSPAGGRATRSRAGRATGATSTATSPTGWRRAPSSGTRRWSCATRTSAGRRRRRLQAVLDHVGLVVPEEQVAELAGVLHFPGYYQPRFTAEELAHDRAADQSHRRPLRLRRAGRGQAQRWSLKNGAGVISLFSCRIR